MIAKYRESPVVLFVDGTYKVNRENYAMYVLMVQDGTGLAQVRSNETDEEMRKIHT